jgi:hypothetical protein
MLILGEPFGQFQTRFDMFLMTCQDTVADPRRQDLAKLPKRGH